MPPRLALALLVISALLNGCGLESNHALSTPATSTIDLRLEGLYVARREKNGDDIAGWHFHYRGAKAGADGRPRATPFLEVLGVTHMKEGGLKGDAYHALTTHLGGHDYISFIELGSDRGKRKASPYGLARYEVGWSGELRVWGANSSAFAEAIKAGKLHGTAKHTQLGDDVLLTDSTEHIATFVAAGNPAILFSGKPLIFDRVAR